MTPTNIAELTGVSVSAVSKALSGSREEDIGEMDIAIHTSACIKDKKIERKRAPQKC